MAGPKRGAPRTNRDVQKKGKSWHGHVRRRRMVILGVSGSAIRGKMFRARVTDAVAEFDATDPAYLGKQRHRLRGARHGAPAQQGAVSPDANERDAEADAGA